MKLLVAAVAVLVAPAAPPAVLCTKQWRLKKSRHCCHDVGCLLTT